MNSRQKQLFSAEAKTVENTVYEKAIKEKYAFTKNLVENPILPEKTELLSG